MKVSMSRSGDVMTVSMRGDLNEDSASELSSLLAKLELPRVVFDMERIELINSIGARYWINMVGALEKRGCAIDAKNCSIAFVESCNIYPKFLPKKAIRSLYIPVSCKCGDQSAVMLVEEQFLNEDPLEGRQCPKCKLNYTPVYEFDDFLQCVRRS